MSSTSFPPRPLSCVLCQHRKVKCDRKVPCSNCIKANVTCIPSKPAPARKSRRVDQGVHDRLAQCESLLKQYTDGSAPSPPVQSVPDNCTPNTFSILPESGPQSAPRTPGRLVEDETGARFVGSHLLARVHEELQAMKNMINVDDIDEGGAFASDDSGFDGTADLRLLGAPSHLAPKDLQPDPANMFRLWQLFLDRVNPLSKLVHAPSMQHYVMEAATDIDQIPANYRALLFSVFAMATVAMSEIECKKLLGSSRDRNIKRFTVGTTAALESFDYLRNYDMVALQALLLYLMSLQRHNDRHAAWILGGLVVRIAQKMGYHRDGETLNLSPYETEMRRRIWWHVIMQDAKSALVSGLSYSLLHTHWDTKVPQNINDAELFPGSTEPLRPRDGPTEMGFCLIGYQMADFMIRVEAINGGSDMGAAILGDDLLGERDDASNSRINKHRELLADLEDRLEKVENRYLDRNAGPVHIAALSIRTMLVSKMREMLVPMREQPEWGTDIRNNNDNLFKILLMNTENSTQVYEIMEDTGFLWFFKLHLQPDILAAMTGQLVQRPTGVLSDRAWSVLEKIYRFHPELLDTTQKQYAAQGHFVLRAWTVREQAFCQAGQPLPYLEFIHRLRENLYGNINESAPPVGSLTDQLPPQLTEMDHFLCSNMDMSAFNWDIL